MSDSESLIVLAKWAESADRYEDMASYMKQVTTSGSELSQEARNLLSVAYKNVVGARRSSWRVLSSLEEKVKQDDLKAGIAAKYKKRIEVELNDLSNEVLNLLDTHLISSASDDESKVFYLKMKGDYYRYLAEVAVGDDRKEIVEKCHESYKEASTTAEALLATHPVRLGLALNYSVFHYEIADNPDVACSLAKDAFDAAVEGLDNLDQDSYKDSTLIMQLLRDNLTLWMSERDGEDDAPERA